MLEQIPANGNNVPDIVFNDPGDPHHWATVVQTSMVAAQTKLVFWNEWERNHECTIHDGSSLLSVQVLDIYRQNPITVVGKHGSVRRMAR